MAFLGALCDSVFQLPDRSEAQGSRTGDTAARGRCAGLPDLKCANSKSASEAENAEFLAGALGSYDWMPGNWPSAVIAAEQSGRRFVEAATTVGDVFAL